MDPRYIGKVVSVVDEHNVVVNVGEDHDLWLGQKFLIVSLGDLIFDPDTGQALEQLELVKGKVEATHIQRRISTLTSAEKQRDPEVREIKRHHQGSNLIGALYGHGRNSITESVQSGIERTLPLRNPQVGDFIIVDK